LTYCRGDVTPVSGAGGVRQKSMALKSFRKPSRGSAALNPIGSISITRSSRRPKSWSRNCPQTQPHWVTSFSENRFCPTSLKIRLLMNRAGRPGTMRPIPSAYAGGAIRR
jgi:hypothetical protein